MNADYLRCRPLAPRWWCWFLRETFDRALLQHSHRFLNRAFELRIFAGDDFLGPVLDVDVRRDSFVLNRPFSITREEAPARRDHRSAIDERRRVGCVNETAPRSLADQQSYLATLEHIRHQVAARARHFVNDHHLRTPNAG